VGAGAFSYSGHFSVTMDFKQIFHDAREKATEQIWPLTVKPQQYLQSDVIIDVRSPVEFEKSHIPFAKNIPLFTNEERAEVGTLFKTDGKEAGLKLGLEKVEANIESFGAAICNATKDKKTCIVYCRGGRMRSSSVCHFINELLGPTIKVGRLEGGHKGYRQWVIEYVPPVSFVLITGRTGSGKTRVLHQLKKLGEQIIDLEKEAHHRGSAFGLLGADQQPRSAQFQNMLVHKFLQLDPKRVVYLEHEHTRIGSCHLPNALATFLCEEPTCIFHVHKQISERVETILSEYASFGPEKLSACLKKIQKKKFSGNLEQIEKLIRDGSLDKAVVPLLTYYDKLYDKGLIKRMEQVKSKCKIEHLHFDNNRYAEQAKEVRRRTKAIMSLKDRGLSGALVLLFLFLALAVALYLNRLSGNFEDKAEL